MDDSNAAADVLAQKIRSPRLLEATVFPQNGDWDRLGKFQAVRLMKELMEENDRFIEKKSVQSGISIDRRAAIS